MDGRWQTVSLRAAGVSLLDCDHRTPPAAAVGYPYVAIPQMKEGRLDLREARLIAPAHFEEWTRKTRPTAHDVIVSRRCNPGETAVVPPGLNCALGQNLVILRADGVKVFPPFLRWLARGVEWWEQVASYINVGAVFDSLKCADIPEFRLSIPPLPEQKRIAHILGTLDDKIELNRRMCQTLEEMARALFKSWFVDFDPVRAKAEGRQPAGMDAATAALFPDSFADSELGPIPKGWEVKRLGDVAENVRRPVSAGAAEPETPYVGLEHMPRRSVCLWVTGRAGEVTSQKSAFRRGEILFGKLRPYFHKVTVAIGDGVCSTDILVLAPRVPEHFGFVLGHVNSDEFVSFADAASTGTRMPRTSWHAMARYAVALPPESVVTAWNGYAQRFVAQLRANITDTQTLAAARDVLLPRLLNGELCTPDAERVVADISAACRMEAP